MKVDAGTVVLGTVLEIRTNVVKSTSSPAHSTHLCLQQAKGDKVSLDNAFTNQDTLA